MCLFSDFSHFSHVKFDEKAQARRKFPGRAERAPRALPQNGRDAPGRDLRGNPLTQILWERSHISLGDLWEIGLKISNSFPITIMGKLWETSRFLR